MPNATAQASGGWLRRCIKHARENRYSLLLEGVFRDPPTVTKTIDQFAAAGYRVEVVGLAVPHQESLLSTLGRFLNPTGDEPPRWTPATAHDSAYRKIPSTLQAAEDTEGTWRLRVTNRLAEDLYTSTREPAGERKTSPIGSAAIAAEQERDAPPPPETARYWLEKYIEHSRELARRGQVNPKTQETLERLADHARAAGHIAFPDSPEVRQAIDKHAERLHAVPRDTRTELPNVSLPTVDFKTVTDHLRQSAEKAPLGARESRAWLDSYSMCARRLIERDGLTKHTAPTMLALHTHADQIAPVAYADQDNRLAQQARDQVVHKGVFRAGNRGVPNSVLPSSPAQYFAADTEQQERYKEAMRSTRHSAAAVSKRLVEKARQGSAPPGPRSDKDGTRSEEPHHQGPEENKEGTDLEG